MIASIANRNGNAGMNEILGAISVTFGSMSCPKRGMQHTEKKSG